MNSDNDIESFLEVPCQMFSPIKPFSPEEVRGESKNINPRKVPDYELITVVILKHLARKDCYISINNNLQ